jgi:hypothetical protein
MLKVNVVTSFFAKEDAGLEFKKFKHYNLESLSCTCAILLYRCADNDVVVVTNDSDMLKYQEERLIDIVESFTLFREQK